MRAMTWCGGDGVALGDEDLGDRAGGRRRELHVDLVRRELHHGLAVLDGVADLDGPLQDGRLGHRLAALGRDDVDDLGRGVVGAGLRVGRRAVGGAARGAARRRSARSRR